MQICPFQPAKDSQTNLSDVKVENLFHVGWSTGENNIIGQSTQGGIKKKAIDWSRC